MKYQIKRTYHEKSYTVKNQSYYGYSNVVVSIDGKEVGTLAYKKNDVFYVVGNLSWSIKKTKITLLNTIYDVVKPQY
jgi:hypothetical protein